MGDAAMEKEPRKFVSQDPKAFGVSGWSQPWLSYPALA